MSPVTKNVASFIAASALALAGAPVFAQGYDLEDEEGATESTTSETVGGEIPNAAIWAGVGLLGLAAVIASSDGDDDDTGPSGTTP